MNVKVDMTYRKVFKGAALAVLCASTVAACQAGTSSPTSPSAAIGQEGNLNSDGSNLKSTPPFAIFPLFESTEVSQTVSLAARAGTAKFQLPGAQTFPHRFQVADSETFGTILAEGAASVDATGIVRFTISPALPLNKRVVWRVRAEFSDAAGPWSNVMAFTTVKGTATPTTPTPSTPAPGNLPRPADPPAGVRLPLPDFTGVLAQFADARDSCPRGLKYVNNPWQDRVIDAFRQRDSRWGYNAKPTRTAADNGGVPVVAAGDEAAYHWVGGPDEGATDVGLVDMLVGHCGSPSLTWRVFTGEEPGRWTGAGRF
jgi:hypothetical protein